MDEVKFSLQGLASIPLPGGVESKVGVVYCELKYKHVVL